MRPGSWPFLTFPRDGLQMVLGCMEWDIFITPSTLIALAVMTARLAQSLRGATMTTSAKEKFAISCYVIVAEYLACVSIRQSVAEVSSTIFWMYCAKIDFYFITLPNKRQRYYTKASLMEQSDAASKYAWNDKLILRTPYEPHKSGWGVWTSHFHFHSSQSRPFWTDLAHP
jgi:hypothetical protein